MTASDDLAVVVALACVTEDRTDREQKALLRVADRVDNTLNRAVADNHGWDTRPPSRLYDEAQDTRVLDDGQRRVELPKRTGLPRCPECGRAARWVPPDVVERHDPTCRHKAAG